MTFAKEMDYFDGKYGAPTFKNEASLEVLEELKRHLPLVIVEYYEKYGFSVFWGGYFQFVNPLTYAPVLRQWIQGTEFENEDEFFVVAMSCMGELKVWGKCSGRRFSISPWQDAVLSSGSSNLKAIASGKGNVFAEAMLFKFELDESSIDGRFFKEALTTLGPPGPDQMYGFVPALPLGGELAPENLKLVSAPEYLSMLADLGPKPVLTISDLAKRAFGAGADKTLQDQMKDL